jgi:FkbM family methyltransferase
LYQLYLALARRGLAEARQREIAFYRDLLHEMHRGDMIFDIGANQGYKTDIFLRLGARVVAVDPDEWNVRTLRETFLLGRLRPKPVAIVQAAVSACIGQATFYSDGDGGAKNTLSEKWVETLRHDPKRFGETLGFAKCTAVETTTLDALIHRWGIPFYVKIDVEGHEEQVLLGLTQKVPYLSFEVNRPEFNDEGRRCLARLRDGKFNFACDVADGLAMKRWLGYEDFLRVFEALQSPSIEVFWKSNQTRLQT